MGKEHKPRPERKFREEFKKDAVELVLTTGRPIPEVAKELGLYDSSAPSCASVPSGWCSTSRGGRQKRGAVAQVADQLDINRETLRNWIRAAEVDRGGAPGA